MSITSYIQHLRAKPEHVRNRISLFSALGITVVIAAFWLASFTSVGTSSKEAVTAAVSRAGTPLSSLTASVGSLASDLKDMIFGSRTIKYSEVEVKAAE
jgi:hypothetical protein